MDAAYSSVCVIIPTYKRPGNLRTCVGGLLSQKHLPDAIVIASASPPGSTAPEEAFVESVKSVFPNIRLTHCSPGSAGVTRNAGMDAVPEGMDIVAFTDDDCIPYPDWITTLFELHNRYPDIALTGDYAVNRSDFVSRYGFSLWHNGKDAGITHVDTLVGGNFSLKWREFIATGVRFDPGFDTGEDCEMGLHLVSLGKSILKSNAVDVLHLARHTPWSYMKRGYQFGYGDFFFMERYDSSGRKLIVPGRNFRFFRFLVNLPRAYASVIAQARGKRWPVSFWAYHILYYAVKWTGVLMGMADYFLFGKRAPLDTRKFAWSRVAES